MRRQRQIGFALLGLIFTLGQANADTITITKTTKRSFQAGGVTYYWVDVEGNFTANMLPGQVQFQRYTGNPATPTDWGATTNLQYNAATMTGTFSGSTNYMVTAVPVTIRSQLKNGGGTVTATSTDVNVRFP